MGAGIERKHFTVIGAGAVGTCTALHLLKDGHAVTLIDRMPPGNGCSFGNAGLIQTGACVPVATPGVLKQVPSMMMDPDGPLVIRWRNLLRLAPYLAWFVAAARPGRVEAISVALQAILNHAAPSYRDLLREAGALDLLKNTGELYVYESPRSYERARTWHDLRRRQGVEVVDLPPEELPQLEPALARIFVRGVYLPNSVQMVSPYAVTSALARHFVAAGGEFVLENVQDILVEDGCPKTLVTDTSRRRIDQVVIATGAYSKRWTSRLAGWIPLDTERGYHLMLSDPGVSLRGAILSGDHRFAIAPMMDGVRLAGTAELACLDAPPNYDRADRLLGLAKRVVPGLRGESRTRWMGHRPSTPDSLPVIGRSPRHSSVYLAFGHGHLGMTLGAITGRLIADLAAGRPSIVDLSLYDIRRFNWASLPS